MGKKQFVISFLIDQSVIGNCLAHSEYISVFFFSRRYILFYKRVSAFNCNLQLKAETLLLKATNHESYNGVSL